MTTKSTQSQFSYKSSRNFGKWMQQMKLTFAVSSYKNANVFYISSYKGDDIELTAQPLSRPMGLFYNKPNDSLYIASIGNIFRFQNMGPEKTVPEVVNSKELEDVEIAYDASFYPREVALCGDLDLHDLKVVDNVSYFISSLFNCVCKTTPANSFEVYWAPPWITKNGLGQTAQEDRCHLNGLCCVDNKPRYVTSASMTDELGGWKEKGKKNAGVVWDIVENRLVCSNLSHPHSPKWDPDTNRLWVLNSGYGQVGWIDVKETDPTKSFHPVKFVPGFLRGSVICGTGKNKVIVVCTSLDRHDSSFDHIELGNILKTKDVESKCGLWVININTFDVVGNIVFEGITELYDIVELPFILPSHYTVDSKCMLTKFHVKEHVTPTSNNQSINDNSKIITKDETETL